MSSWNVSELDLDEFTAELCSCGFEILASFSLGFWHSCIADLETSAKFAILQGPKAQAMPNIVPYKIDGSSLNLLQHSRRNQLPLDVTLQNLKKKLS